MDGNTHEVVIIMYSRLYYPQAHNEESLIDFATEKFGGSKLTDSIMNNETAFHISKHTKVF